MNLSLNHKNATVMAFSMSAVSLVFTKPDVLLEPKLGPVG